MDALKEENMREICNTVVVQFVMIGLLVENNERNDYLYDRAYAMI